MRSIRDAGNTTLQWVTPSFFKRYYELRAGDEVLVTMLRVPGFRDVMQVKAAEGEWLLKREGFFQTRTVVRDEQSGEEVGTLSRDRLFQFVNGQNFLWKRLRTGFLSGHRVWETPIGEVVLHLQKGGKQVEIEPAALAYPELALLAAQAYWLIKQEQQAASAGG